MRTGVPCNENRVFPVIIDLQGVPCKPYRVWVYSVKYILALLCSKSQAEVSEPEAYDSVRCGARLCVVSCMYCSILYVVDFL